MTSLARRGTREELSAPSLDEPPLAPSPEATIWLALVPCAAVSFAAMMLLGPPLGRLVFPEAGASLGFWRPGELTPEPTEQGRFLILLAAAMLLPAVTVAAWRRGLRLGRRTTRVGVAVAQLSTIAFVVASWAGQYTWELGRVYFRPATLVVAGLLAVATATVAGFASPREHAVALLRESRGRRAIAVAVAVAMTAIWMLHAVNSDRSIGWANSITMYHVQFPLDEAFAVVNGLTPLVDYSPQYGSLWPYVGALSMIVFGKTLLVYTITMAALSSVALLAVFDVLRRLARSSLAALLLYLPLLATTSFMVFGTWESRHTFGSYFPSMPLRYGGPYLVAWLTARHLERRGAARTWPLFLAAGLVTLNNTDFGLACFGATIAAALWTTPRIDARSLARLAANVAAGAAGALALVAALTLVRAGALPDLSRLVEFPRIYLEAGFALIKLPHVMGLHFIIYATYVAAIGAGTVHALRRSADRALTGMLVWSGVFGLGAASYFVARSGDDTMPMTFSAWAFALALLAIVAVRQMAAQRRLPSLALLAVFYGMGVLACSLAQTPPPWQQLDNLRGPPTAEAGMAPLYVPPSDRRTRVFVSSIANGRDRFVLREGAPVAIFAITGHRIADAYGVRNVVPTTGVDSIQTRMQFDEALDALRAAGGNTALIPRVSNVEMFELLARRGFEILMPGGLRPWREGLEERARTEGEMTKWVDTRHLRPEALE